MFSLLEGFFRWLFSKTEVQILILGLDHAGKTTLLEQMKGVFQKVDGIPLDKIPPTVGLNIGRMDIGNCKVIFWDLGGQANIRSIWDKYYAEAHGLVFVLDSADASRFQEAKEAMDSLLQHPELSGVPILVCANKQDLPQAFVVNEIDEYFKAPADGYSGKPRQRRLQAVSALTCAGVEDGIRWLIDTVLANPDVVRVRSPRPPG